MDKETSQLLRSLFDPSITEFVNWEKFLASQKFAKISRDQIDHFVKHGDFSYIKKMLDQLRGSKSFKPTLLWFCDSAGLDFSFTAGELVLKRAASARTKEGDLKGYMAKYSGTAKDVGGDGPRVATIPTCKRQKRLNVAKSVHSVDKDGVFSSYPKRLDEVPPEYQAAVYAKQLRERQAEKDKQRKSGLNKLRTELNSLREKLRLAQSEAGRIELRTEIASKEKAIRKAPKPKRGWSPVLSGSFESGKKR